MTTTTGEKISTSTTARVSKTPEERKAHAEALHSSISEQVEQLRTTETWAAFLTFARAFHTYSINNVLLILSQNPTATQVAGFRAWQGLGRQVRKGETGIRIFGYSQKTITEEDDTGEEKTTHIPRFPILSVFDIDQTDPIDGAVDPTLTRQLTGSTDHNIITTLTNHLITLGWTVTHIRIPGAVNGYANPHTQTVALDSELSPEHQAKTLIHETAHILLGHTDTPADYSHHRGLMEVEAESVAYIVAGLAGFDTSAYSIGYIAGWANANTELIRETATRVLRTAHHIATVLEPNEPNTENLS